ncbi:MAG TPA: regulatory iron-sulfur-containing complex subunit RicT [Gemmatimonadales bacterium]|nr:regulatory iron-sulfur-containing complex subunit RicT [Gemmatimonadales bacterium]
MNPIVEVRFKGNRKEYFTWTSADPLRLDEAVIVEVERGQDLGRVSALGALAARKCTRCGACGLPPEAPLPLPPGESPKLRRILRRATREEVRQAEELRRSEDEVRRKVRERVFQHALPMKVSDAEWQWDRKKLTVYFTADQRVDFRALVRDLAAQYRARIELRQISARDEARRLDGIGRCGRQLCISSWLPEARPVSLSLAKDQRLSLNPAQISGPCGRLLCCLHYEHQFYVESRKRFPKEGKLLRTTAGSERVVAVDIFRDRVTLRHEPEGAVRVVPLERLQREIEAGA